MNHVIGVINVIEIMDVAIVHTEFCYLKLLTIISVNSFESNQELK